MATQDEIPDPEVQQALQKVLYVTIVLLLVMVMNALLKITSVGDDDTQLQDVVQSECDILLSCGFTTKAIHSDDLYWNPCCSHVTLFWTKT